MPTTIRHACTSRRTTLLNRAENWVTVTPRIAGTLRTPVGQTTGPPMRSLNAQATLLAVQLCGGVSAILLAPSEVCVLAGNATPSIRETGQ